MADYVTASNGVQLEIAALAKTYTWVGGFMTAQTVVYSGVTYIQTITNNGTNITGISKWVAQ